MHLRLDDVDKAAAAVHQGCRHEAIHEAFGDRLAIRSDGHIGEHVLPNIPDQAQGTARNAASIALLVVKPKHTQGREAERAMSQNGDVARRDTRCYAGSPLVTFN